MKILFAGPSLFGCDADLSGIDCRAPARQGDIHRAVGDGATVIGLVDGYFGAVAAVWHKEILFALSEGVHVLGAASMGALRAAECAAFGMEPIGEIARLYGDGSLEDDDAVALVHAPAELDFMPISEALVDMAATLQALFQQQLIDGNEAVALLASAQRTYFADRNPQTMACGAGLTAARAAEVADLFQENRVSLKQRDALALVSRLRAMPDQRKPAGTKSWTFQSTPAWRRAFSSPRAAV
jgi:hypothetical protein